MEYYTVKPAEPSKVGEAIRDFLDGALDPLLGTANGSLPIKFLYKYFGPGSASNEINKVITREDGFFYLDGVRVIADNVPKAEVAAALTLLLRGAAMTVLGAATLPIALEVTVAGLAAIGATYAYQAFDNLVLSHIYELFGVASTRLEVADSSGQAIAGVVYRNGLASEGKTQIDAALSLLNRAAGKFGVNSHIAVYVNSDNENAGYDVLAGNHLAQIAGALGIATTVIADRTGLKTDGAVAKNSDLLTPYLSGADFTVMQTGAKIGLHMYSNDNNGNGEDVWLLKKEMAVGGSLSGLDLQAAKIAVFGSDGADNLDMGGATGKVYAYGGVGSDTIRGGTGADVLWGDSPVGPGNGVIDFIHGGAGNDQIFGGGGGDQLFGDDGADYIEGGIGDDTIDGGTENDEIWGGVGSDTIRGGEGKDIIRGGSSVPGENDTDKTNKLYGDGGNDEIYGAEGSDELYGGADDDKLSGLVGDDKLFGGAGNDRLTGGAGADKFYVGTGDIVMDSEAADKLFVGDDASESAADYIEVTQPDDPTPEFREYSDLKGNYLQGYNYFYLGQGGEAGTFINTGHSLVILTGSETSPDAIIAKDYQTGDFGLDIFDPAKFAAKAKENYELVRNHYSQEHFILTPYLESLRIALKLEAQANSQQQRSSLLRVLDTPTEITGTQDIDFLQGTAGDDQITGGGELDLLLGGAGSDIYRYAAGDGDDYIMDYDGNIGDVDVLTFDNLNLVDIDLSGSGTDLYIDVLGAQPSTIAITNQFAAGLEEGIEEIHFADGTVLTRAQILEALQVNRGTSGDDELYTKAQQINGEWQPTVFIGGHGDDHLYGGDDGDTYVYAKGDGNDTIEDFGDNVGTLRLSDLNPADISVSSLSDNTIVVTISETGETITVKPFYDHTIGFDKIVFANGTIWDRDDIIAATHAPRGATLTGDQVAENAVNGTVVGTVAGIDPDADAVLTYSLTNDAGGRFAIDATSGQITVANGALLNFESAASHSVVVRVTDQTGLTFDKSLTLNVTDVNEAPTAAALTGGSVAENAANGTVVGTVAGSDPDAGATLTYTLTDNAGGRFAINANTGQITVANGTLLDYETATSHGVTVRVTDQGGLTFDKSFTIAVTDVSESANHAPTNATLTGGSVGENAANGTAVGTVAGVDPDAGATLSYALTDNAGGRFAINATTGQITVADGALLNYESAASHSVTVRVTDQGGLTFDKSFTLNVTNVNEAPTNATLSGGSVAENAANGTTVGTVAGVDPDAGATLTYALTDNAGGRFAINTTTGLITVAAAALLNYEAAASHNVTVRVTDQSGLTFDKTFTLNLTNVNEAPTNATLTGGSVAENAANGTVVGTAAGADPDAGATLTYALTDNAGGRFAINATTGQITVADGALLNYESATSHNVTVRVTDQGGLTFDKTFALNVSNVNEAPTNATLTGGSVAENAANGTVVGTAAGVDPDAGATLTYALTDNAGGRFAINATTGQITVANGALLNYESASSHNVTVRVTDQGGLTFDKTLTLNVTNVNEAPTNATLTGGSIAENAANGTVVGSVAGVDPDAGAVLSYSLTDNAGGRFAINATTGQITVANGTLLDYETATSHAITVHVVDQGGLVFDKVLTIAVTDVSETVNHAPTNATLSGGSIAENASNGSVVGTVAGVDPDSGAVLTYSLTDNAGGRFAINASSGQITVANGGLLDYESATAHNVTVRVTDQGGLTFDKVFALNVTNVAGATQNGTSAANTLTGTAEEDVLNGLGGNDTLNGLGGNDTLDGGIGNDTMNGGTGNDIYIVDAAGDVVNENANEGIDEVRTSLSSYVLGANVENLTATTSTALTANGNALNNIIKGNSGNDVLFGGAGNDTMLGGAGDDVLQGDDGDDIFDGQGGQNWITTGTGQDRLIFNSASGYLQVDDFSDGNDKIDMRGTGITLQNAAQSVTLTEYPEGGVLVEFGTSQIWFENIMPGQITFAGDFIFDTAGGGNHAPTNATLSGGSVAENSANGTVVGTITGVDPDAGAVLSYSLADNAGGRFAIDATTGQITVANGTLLDYETATSHNISVHVVDQGGLSFDKVFTLGITDVAGVTQNGTSAANTLTGTNEGDTLNGLGGNDTLNGLGGNDVLDGGTGNDTLNGGTGNDVYIVDSYDDVVNENANEGVDEVQTALSSYNLGNNVENLTGTNTAGFTAGGNALNNIITGSSGNDVLFGEDGNDILRGGAGDDVMQGGEGNDTFQGQGGTKWITTGNGADVLVFNASSGGFQVDDFTDGSDKIDMRGTGVTLQNAAANVTLTEYAEGGVLVQFGSSEIWLEHVMPGQITFANDFIFS